jgi:hypothetical protein
MRALLAILLALATAPGALAQTPPGTPVPVRTGAHDGFTRVVFQFARPRDWTLDRTDAGYRITLAAPSRFDTSAIWQRIGRDRLAGLSAAPDGRSVQLDLACMCHATSFIHNGSWLVIDIHDGASPDTQLATGEAGPAPGSAALPADDTPPAALPAVLPRTPPGAAPTDAGDLLARAARVADAQAAVLEEISRAASQGLLQGTPDLPPARARPNLAQRPDAGAPGTAPDADTLAARIGILADTAVDQDQAPRRPDAAAGCPARDQFDVAEWGNSDPVAFQIGARRRALIGEFDRIDPRAATDLARLYIHLGFGREADLVVTRLAAASPEAPYLQTLATIVDTGTAPPGNPVGRFLDCPGPVALWAALARPRLAPGAPVRRADLAQAFTALPDHLRHHLGPYLAERLLDHGDAELAGVIRRATTRAPGDPQPRAALAGARIDLAAGSEAAGRAALETVARGTSPEAAEALAMLLEKLSDEGAAVPNDLIDLAAARAFELRAEALSTRLKAAELRARAANGDPAGALDALARAGRDGTAPPDMLAALVRALATRASDPVLARSYFRHRERIDAATLPPATARALAQRLAGAGLPDPALALLDLQGRTAAPEDRLLRAEIHLAMDDPDAALAELDRIEGARTEALRARALARRGEAEAALAALSPAANAGLRADVAWQAGDWETVRALGEAPQRAALAAAAPAAAVTDAPPSLIGSRALLSQSAAARASLRALLDAYPVPEAAPGTPATN